MSTTHRLFCAATAAVWAVVLLISFGMRPEEGPWHTLMILAGCLGVVLVPYVTYPLLLRSVIRNELADVTAIFLAGWEAAQEPESDEPTTVPLRRAA